MARIHSSARMATRFSGEGFGSGFQYRRQKPIPVTLGPWERVVWSDRIDVQENTLQNVVNGILYEGVLYPLGASYTEVETATTVTLAAGNVIISGVEYHFHAYKVISTNRLWFALTVAAGTVTTHDTGLTYSGTDPLFFAQWGTLLYYGAASLTLGIYKYDNGAGTSTLVGSSPTSVTGMLFVDNNLCVTYTSAGFDFVKWSVDSLPEDFASSGSGTFTVPSGLGVKKGFVQLTEDEAVVLCEKGAVRFTATGTLPAFRFAQVDQIRGCPSVRCTASSGQFVFFKGKDDTVSIYDGGSVREITLDDALITSGVAISSISYSSKLDKILVGTNSTTYGTLLLNPSTLKWIGSWAVRTDYLGDSPESSGSVVSYFTNSLTTSKRNKVGLADGTQLAPTYGFVTDARKDKYFHYLDIVFITDPAFSTNPTLTLTAYVENTETTWTVSPTVHDQGRVLRYYFSRVARVLKLSISGGVGGLLANYKKLGVNSIVLIAEDLAA